jgi:hypothetical protein
MAYIPPEFRPEDPFQELTPFEKTRLKTGFVALGAILIFAVLPSWIGLSISQILSRLSFVLATFVVAGLFYLGIARRRRVFFYASCSLIPILQGREIQFSVWLSFIISATIILTLQYRVLEPLISRSLKRKPTGAHAPETLFDAEVDGQPTP